MGGGKITVLASGSEWAGVLDQAKAQGKPVLVDFTATWCGPCRAIAPFFEELSEKYEGIVFVKVDVDQCAEVAQSCNVTCMPTFQAFFDGKKVDEFSGADKSKLQACCDKLISNYK